MKSVKVSRKEWEKEKKKFKNYNTNYLRSLVGMMYQNIPLRIINKLSRRQIMYLLKVDITDGNKDTASKNLIKKYS